VDFADKSTIVIKIDQPGASIVLVRLLSSEADPNSPLGIVGDKTLVQPGGLIKVKLEREYMDIQQISVHGGPNPWNYNLGSGNLGARILSITVVP
jgi:hypothetical protein